MTELLQKVTALFQNFERNVTIYQMVLKIILAFVKLSLEVKNILIHLRKVLHMTIAFIGGTIAIYTLVMKHVLKNVSPTS
ncbi:hypothetical protein SAMN04488577_2061 [Bacillus sp. cl95]|nr:hypothetical protein SAMN02799634_103431 [Bacillus sp. UNCCL13]SFQ81566.1 hypothetical protein SAMN04488577_2061 [Bacillus sp. cl95]